MPPDEGGTSIVRAFLAAFPDLPLFRLQIRPGEAYIAPTERLAHDATTWDRLTMDMTIHMHGRFQPCLDASEAQPAE